MMVISAAAAMGLQALVMGVDEFRFHRERGLSRWERIGHPLDTLSVLACYGIALVMTPTAAAQRLYCALAILSCLLVTKDELVHSKQCGPWEHWLHSLLFLLHPIVLGCVYWLWYSEARWLLFLETALTFALGLYQTLYWNTGWLKSDAA
jgi:hypothetical protein